MQTYKKGRDNLLMVNKNITYYVQRNKNKQYSFNGNRINISKTDFSYGETVFLYDVGNDEILMTTKKKKYPLLLENKISSLTMGGKEKVKVLSLKRALKGENYYCFYKQGKKEYLLSPANEKQIIEFGCKRNVYKQSGMVTNSRMLRIGTNDRDKLINNYDYLTITVHQNPCIYMEIVGSNKKEYPTLKECWYAGQCENNKFTYQVETDYIRKHHALFLPMSFINKGNIQKRNFLKCYFAPDNKFVVEVDDVYCEVCGKAIRRKPDVGHAITTSKSTKESLTPIRNMKQQNISNQEIWTIIKKKQKELEETIAELKLYLPEK